MVALKISLSCTTSDFIARHEPNAYGGLLTGYFANESVFCQIEPDSVDLVSK